MTPRLQQCLDAGDVLALFPLLKDWPEDELRALLADVETFYDETQAAIQAAYNKAAFLPEHFFSRANSKALDRAVDDKRKEALAVCAEIASVAMYYLGVAHDPR